MIREGEISSAELVEAHLERIAEVNPRLNAVVEVLAETAREGARAADARRAGGALVGPLDGVPFSIKDSIEVAGTSCSAGTLGFRNAPRSDARRHAGGSIAGGWGDTDRADQFAGSVVCVRERQFDSRAHQ